MKPSCTCVPSVKYTCMYKGWGAYKPRRKPVALSTLEK